MEEDKAQQDPSDPESTTSSLTMSSRSAQNGGAHAKAPAKTVSEEQDSLCEKKRPAPASGLEAAGSGKKPRLRSHGSNLSSSMSDLTDSNKESSLNSDDQSPERSGTTEGSISSDAAVAADSEKKAPKNHADVLVRKRKLPPVETTSLEESFELDYEEVFLKSNVPQMLATTSGRIIACKCILGESVYVIVCQRVNVVVIPHSLPIVFRERAVSQCNRHVRKGSRTNIRLQSRSDQQAFESL